MARLIPKGFFNQRFDLLVISCLATYVLITIADSEKYVGLLTALPIFGTIVIAQRATEYSGAWRHVGRLAVLAGAVFAIISTTINNRVIYGLASGCFALALVITLATVYIHVINEPDSSLQTMFAALVCYLLVGLVFSLFDTTLAIWTQRFFAQAGQHHPSDYAYFSFITMTTVGYGDLTPAVGYPRSMAVLEAVIAQMVLVTLVARTVASLSQEQWRERRRERRARAIEANKSTDEPPLT